jgi:hypothetical protein
MISTPPPPVFFFSKNEKKRNIIVQGCKGNDFTPPPFFLPFSCCSYQDTAAADAGINKDMYPPPNTCILLLTYQDTAAADAGINKAASLLKELP